MVTLGSEPVIPERGEQVVSRWWAGVWARLEGPLTPRVGVGEGGSGGPGHSRPGNPPEPHSPLARGPLDHTEHLCPPPGFYELSDGGSCSLSTSCTSVCSDHVSCSLGTLLPAAPKARPGSGDCRPRSADETAVCGVPLPAWGPPASEEGPGQLFQEEPRPRPVSTGEESQTVGDPLGPRAPPEEVGAAPSSHPGGGGPDLPSTEQGALCLWGASTPTGAAPGFPWAFGWTEESKACFCSS